MLKMLYKKEGIKMKKVISLSISMLLVVGLITGCGCKKKEEKLTLKDRYQRIKVRGRIRVFFFVRMAVLIFFDRRLKAVYRKGKDVLGGI